MDDTLQRHSRERVQPCFPKWSGGDGNDIIIAKIVVNLHNKYMCSKIVRLYVLSIGIPVFMQS